MWRRTINNGTTSKYAVYDWGHENSVPRRILPRTPPPPRWCWGSIDGVLKEAEELKCEANTEDASVDAVNKTDDCDDFESSFEEIEETSDTARVIEYNHGRKFLANPLFQKVSSDQKPKHEDEQQVLDVAPPIDVDGFSETNQKPILTEKVEDRSPKHEDFSASETASSCSSGEQKMPINNGDYLKDKKERFPLKIGGRSTVLNTRRKFPPRKMSDLDLVIGQKLSKVRMSTSARSYAKPPKMNKPAGSDLKAVEEKLTKMEEGSDDDLKESVSSKNSSNLKLRNDIFETC